jgi:uncharacterized RDD family membrane protein YckC
MAEDLPGPTRSGNPNEQPGERSTEPLGGPVPPSQPPPAYGQPGGWPQPPGDTAPVPRDQYPPPPAVLPAGGPPREALAGFWRRLAAMILDWLLVGVLAGAIAALFGLDAVSIPTATPPEGDGFEFRFDAPAPFGVVELVYFTYFHATSAGQSIGNKILGIRVLDADSGGSLPYVRAFVRALMSYLSALPCFLGFFWMLWDPQKRTWHDMVANSLVVRASVYPPGEFGRPAR